jgi:hypothetical protein
MTDQVLTTMSMFERPDALGTACPPDIISQELRDKFGYPAGSIDNDRVLFNAALRASPSSRLGCRHYVSGALHHSIPATALVIKPKVEGPFDLCVVVQKSVEMNRPLPEHAISSVGVVCETVVKVRYFGRDRS